MLFRSGALGILLTVLLQVSFLVTASSAPEESRDGDSRKAKQAVSNEASSSMARSSEEVVSTPPFEKKTEFRETEFADVDKDKKSTEEAAIEAIEQPAEEDDFEKRAKRKPNPFEVANVELPETTKEAANAEQPSAPSFEKPMVDAPRSGDEGVELDIEVEVRRVGAEMLSEDSGRREDDVAETFVVTSEQQDAGPETRDKVVVDISSEAWNVTGSRKEPKSEEAVAKAKSIVWSREAATMTHVAKAKLRLEVSGPKTISVGGKYRVRFRVTNRANVESEEVSISVDLPAGLFHPKGRALIYEMGRMRAGETGDVFLTVRADKAGVATHRAELISAGKIIGPDRKSTRLNSSHTDISRMPSSA